MKHLFSGNSSAYSFHYKYMQHLVLYTVCCIAILMSLHGSTGTCILVASPIHVPPIQHVLKHCRWHTHTHTHTYTHTHTHTIQNNLKGLIHCKSFWNSNTKQLGDLFQKQKIKGSLWNLCAVYAGLKTP